jgi:4-hydroxy-tetrahydrodipicolinate reductase
MSGAGAQTRIVVIGAGGRMGRAIIRMAAERADLRIGGAVVSRNSPELGRDAGEVAGIGRIDVPLRADLAAALTEGDVAVDFSHATATADNLAACVAAGRPLLLGTTVLGDAVKQDIERAARHIALLVAPNTSLGVTLLLELVQKAAQALPADFDIEIVEAHHRMKRDAPSGTALALGQAAAWGRRQVLSDVAVTDRAGLRRSGDIGFATVRGGDIVGDHTVLFAGAGEQVQLTHRATDRNVFARGALQAAAWLPGRSPGQYHMRDIIVT